MPLSSYNPTRTQSTMNSPSVSAGALAQLQAQKQQQLMNAVQGLKGYGQASRTEDFRKTGERGVGSLTRAGQEEYDAELLRKFQYSQQQARFGQTKENIDKRQEYAEKNIGMTKDNQKEVAQFKDKLNKGTYLNLGQGFFLNNKTGKVDRAEDFIQGGAKGLKEKPYKPTGSLRDTYNEKGAEAKDTIKFFDTKEYNLQFKPETYKDKNGKIQIKKGAGTYFFDGRPVTLSELKFLKQDLLRDRARRK